MLDFKTVDRNEEGGSGTWASLTDPGTSKPKKRVSDSQARKLARAVKMFLFFLIRNVPALKPYVSMIEVLATISLRIIVNRV